MDRAEIYLGTQGWSYRDWVGSFYPPGTPSRSYLQYYASQFSAVELDSTFYGTPQPNKVLGWYESTPPDFRFTAKVPKLITHDQRLVNVTDELAEFVEIMKLLEDKLGPILIQLPPDFTADERPALEGVLSQLPEGARYAVEFRHKSWLTDDTRQLLAEHDVAWACLDLVYMPREVHLTTDFCYVRWLGNRKQIQQMHAVQIDRTAQLDDWARTLDEVAQGTQRIYGFANNHYSGHSPADIRYLREKLGVVAPDGGVQQRTLL